MAFSLARATRIPVSDKQLLLAMIGLQAIGLPAIYSASHHDGVGRFVAQLVWTALGFISFFIVSQVDYRVWSRYWRVFWVLTVLALIGTLFTRPINGAHSWIDLGVFRLQPSEFAKFVLILALASLLAKIGPKIHQLQPFLRCLLFYAVPILLILAQPDFGTAVIFCTIWLVMVLLAGARWWMLLVICLAAVLAFAGAWHVGLIKNYQKKRLDFVHADPAGTGYHQRQARIAIGSGQFWGKGFLHGTQGKRGFLPEQDTDFIFAVIGEEFGLFGCLVVVALQLYILLRLLRIAEDADTPFGRLIAGGVAAMLAVHAFINIGMCLTLTPVTGVPLPFISYGGSNLLANMLSIGVVLNVSRHQQAQRDWAAQDTLVRL